MKKFIFTLIFLVLSQNIFADDLKNAVIPTKHNKNMTLKDIAKIQPGLGVIMIEFGHRYYLAYYAAKTKNWDLASYELDEMIEAIEVAEVTRPEYKKLLQGFEHTYIDKLLEAIKEKNLSKVDKLFAKTTKGCNNCHIETKHSFIKYKLPKNPPDFLDLN